ncbi:MAG: DUF5671 domain-containing protein [Chloroflexus sp.]
MAVVRRWYLYCSATIGLQGFAWSLIWLLYPIVIAEDQLSAATIAFQLATLVVCLPLWLGHWLWGEWLARRDPDERASAIRKLYLYANLAAFLFPLISSISDLIRLAVSFIVGRGPNDPQAQLWYGVIVSVTLGSLFAYHGIVAREDARTAPLIGAGALVRRIYLLFVAGIGLLLWANGASELLWLVLSRPEIGNSRLAFSDAVTNLITGLVVWIGHWWRAQQLFATADEDERASVLRKVYLYLVIVVAALTVVSNATLVLVGLIRSILRLPAYGSLSDVIAPLVIAGVIALYHARVLNTDAAAIAEGPRQAGVRRLAWYLVAAIGQITALVGIGGLLSVIIRGLAGAETITDLREPLAWFCSLLIVGLPLWIGCWWRVQRVDAQAGIAEGVTRSSLVRRIYLFGFLFVASLTLLSSSIYILFRFISIALDETSRGQVLTDVAQALAFSVIAGGVIVTNGLVLRADTRLRENAERSRQAQVRVAVLANRELAAPIVASLQQQFPQLMLAVVDDSNGADAQLANADLIVGVWRPSDDLSRLRSVPARKLLVPLDGENWTWIGLEPVVTRTIPNQLVQAVRQTLAGEMIKPYRPVSAGIVVGAAAAVFLVLLLLLGVLQVALFAFGFFF